MQLILALSGQKLQILSDTTCRKEHFWSHCCSVSKQQDHVWVCQCASCPTGSSHFQQVEHIEVFLLIGILSFSGVCGDNLCLQFVPTKVMIWDARGTPSLPPSPRPCTHLWTGFTSSKTFLFCFSDRRLTQFRCD